MLRCRTSDRISILSVVLSCFITVCPSIKHLRCLTFLFWFYVNWIPDNQTLYESKTLDRNFCPLQECHYKHSLHVFYLLSDPHLNSGELRLSHSQAKEKAIFAISESNEDVWSDSLEKEYKKYKNNRSDTKKFLQLANLWGVQI